MTFPSEDTRKPTAHPQDDKADIREEAAHSSGWKNRETANPLHGVKADQDIDFHHKRYWPIMDRGAVP